MDTTDRSPTGEDDAGRLHQLLIFAGLGLFVLALLVSGFLGATGPTILFFDGDDGSNHDPFSPSPNDGSGDNEDINGLEVVEFSATESVSAGDTIAVEFTLENSGASDVEQEITLTFDGDIVAEESVELEEGESASFSHDIDTVGQSPGEYELELAGSDVMATTSIEITDGEDSSSQFSITAFTMTDTATAGDEVEVEYTIENHGDTEGSTDVVLMVDDEPAVERSLSLDPDESTTTTEVIDTDGMEPGEYDIALITDDDREQRTLTLEEAGEADFAVTELDVPDQANTDDEFEIEYTVENVGDAAGSTMVQIEFDGTTVAEEEVPLEPGESVTETGLIETDDMAEGLYPVDVIADDEGAREWIELVDEDGAEFTIVDLEAPDEASPGDVIEVEYTIENDGDAAGTTPVTVHFDGDVVVEKEVDLEAGETYEETVEIDTDGYDEGEYPIDVAVDGDEERHWIELEEEDDDGLFGLDE